MAEVTLPQPLIDAGCSSVLGLREGAAVRDILVHPGAEELYVLLENCPFITRLLPFGPDRDLVCSEAIETDGLVFDRFEYEAREAGDRVIAVNNMGFVYEYDLPE
jgi:hypothetical protein